MGSWVIEQRFSDGWRPFTSRNGEPIRFADRDYAELIATEPDGYDDGHPFRVVESAEPWTVPPRGP